MFARRRRRRRSKYINPIRFHKPKKKNQINRLIYTLIPKETNLYIQTYETKIALTNIIPKRSLFASQESRLKKRKMRIPEEKRRSQPWSDNLRDPLQRISGSWEAVHILHISILFL